MNEKWWMMQMFHVWPSQICIVFGINDSIFAHQIRITRKKILFQFIIHGKKRVERTFGSPDKCLTRARGASCMWFICGDDDKLKTNDTNRAFTSRGRSQNECTQISSRPKWARKKNENASGEIHMAKKLAFNISWRWQQERGSHTSTSFVNISKCQAFIIRFVACWCTAAEQDRNGHYWVRWADAQIVILFTQMIERCSKNVCFIRRDTVSGMVLMKAKIDLWTNSMIRFSFIYSAIRQVEMEMYDVHGQ